MVGFPPGSVLLQYLTLSWPPVLQLGLVGTWWCGNPAGSSEGMVLERQ